MIDRLLTTHLEPITRGSRRWQLWRNLAQCWAVAALAGLGGLLAHRQFGWAPGWMFFGLAGGAIAAAVVIVRRFSRTKPDVRAVARQIELENPELHALLLTAVEQQPDAATGELNYLQQRVIDEAIEHHRRSRWGAQVARQLSVARSLHWAAFALFVLVLAGLRPDFSHGYNIWEGAERSNGIFITPGDTNLERGSGLVVLARFEGKLPAEAELVITSDTGKEQRITLAKNLGDPVFGGGVREVKSDLKYHVEYSHGRTRDFKVGVYDYPRLEHADAKLSYPAYTGLPEKTIPNTRRVSAVEGTSLDYSFFLNKPIASAKLVARDKSEVPLTHDATNASVLHTQIVIDQNKRYELLLTDTEGRTNRVPPEFVLEAFKNRAAELKLTAPRGDQRVSALEEVAFQAEASDDFGLKSYGIAYTLPDGQTKDIELGQNTKPHEKRQFSYLLPMESLNVQPDQVVSYYLWAEDTASDGKPRRVTSDMFFAEIRPFEEIFREGQPQDPNDNQNQNQNQNNQGGQGNRSERLSELQKQIVSATWNLQRREQDVKPSDKYKDDTQVIRDSQQQALEQLQDLKDNADERVLTFVDAAEKAMKKAVTDLGEASDQNSVKPLAPALTDEQAAYQAVMKLSAREYQVTRGQRGQRGGGQRSGSQRAQRQLDQLDLRQTQNRYETQRQAQTQQQSPQQREQLQVTSRLSELAQRQQDLNERLRELQTALQEARTEQERADLQQQLKRLRDDQQNMLADMDELRQRMERPENQANMSQERQQLEQTRSEVQQAADSLNQQAVSQALASGTRAQRELQQLQDELRKKNSSQFAEDMRQMRDNAQQLATNQDAIDQKIGDLADPTQKRLTETDAEKAQRRELAQKLLDQKAGLTNLLDQMRQVSEQSETAEPILSSQLYDLLRQTGQDDLEKKIDSSADLVRRGFAPQAAPDEQRVRQNLDELNRGVARAAESILGDGTEALRTARQELENLSQQLNQELARGGSDMTTNVAGSSESDAELVRRLVQERQQREDLEAALQAGATNALGTNLTVIQQLLNRRAAERGGQPGLQAGQGRQGARGDQNQPGQQNNQPGQRNQPGQQANAGQDRGGQQQPGGQRGQQAQAGQRDGQPGGQRGQQAQAGQRGGQQGGQRGQGDQNGQPQLAGGNRGGDRAGGQRGGDRNGQFQDLLNGNNNGGGYNGGNWWTGGPLTGDNYVDWTDRLRDVQQMIDVPALRTEVTRVLDRVRTIRLDYKKIGQKPDWAVVRTQIAAPLAEVRTRLDEELLRRESKDALVPLDRDPVPTKYSELVRRYYEQLGKDNLH